jgi:solute carrier family 25 folate transporter 32
MYPQVQYKKRKQYSDSFKNAIAASLACLIEQVLHPLDVIEARFQSHDGQKNNNLVPKYRGVASASLEIAATEGVRGLYKGVSLSLLSTNMSRTLFFGVYGKQKSKYEKIYGTHRHLPIVLASVQSSLFTSIVTSPLWVAKTRVVLNTVPQSFKSTFSEIYKEHGIPGFYKGIGISLLLSVQGALQLTMYEYLNKIGVNKGSSGSKISQLTQPAYNAMISRFFVSILLYPFTVVRTRLQQPQIIAKSEAKYKGAIDCFRKSYQNEGVRGFYKGFAPNTMRSLPSNALFFFCYEMIKNAIP